MSSVQALPYVALCASVLALGLVAGFILASPLAPQVPSSLIQHPHIMRLLVHMQDSETLF